AQRAARFGGAQLLEIVITAGWYRVISCLVNALGVECESWAARCPRSARWPATIARARGHCSGVTTRSEHSVYIEHNEPSLGRALRRGAGHAVRARGGDSTDGRARARLAARLRPPRAERGGARAHAPGEQRLDQHRDARAP